MDSKDKKRVENGEYCSDSDAEDQTEKIPYPKAIPFIISNEFCERFNYYGMRTILVLYLNQELLYSRDTSTVIFHIFTMFVYFLCVFGALLADSWLGKFKTILYLSIVYVCGSIMITIGAVPPLNLPATTFTMIGLALIALGSGGIKPCVAAFGGDQFKVPEQLKQSATYFSLFYFAINSGSLISTTITPILREDVSCFGESECYPLAFGIPAVLMFISIVIFILGRPLYKISPPGGNMFALVCRTIGTGVTTYFKERRSNPREHWLDHAEKKYDKKLIADVKVLLRVLVLFLPLPVFWALFDQQGSRWTFQATRMNGDMGGFTIKPDQVQMLNPLLILVFIPTYEVAIYPLLSLVGIRRPLQKLTCGGVLAGIAFIISAVVELNLEKTYPVLPKSGSIQVRVVNGVPGCNYSLIMNLPDLPSFDIGSMSLYENKNVPLPSNQFALDYTVVSTTGCLDYSKKSVRVKEKTAQTFFIKHDGVDTYVDEVNKPDRGQPLVRTLASIKGQKSIEWQDTETGYVDYSNGTDANYIAALQASVYAVTVDGTEVFNTKLRQGGVYTFIVGEGADGQYDAELFEIVKPNSVNILWLIPQFVILTLGEVMFSVTGLQFSYSQAPVSMKSVLQACWQLTVAFGNVIVVIIAEMKLFESQASEFFLFAGLMFVDMIVFSFLAYRYVPNDPNLIEETCDTQTSNHTPVTEADYKSD